MHPNFIKISKEIQKIQEAWGSKLRGGLGAIAASSLLGGTSPSSNDKNFGERNVPQNYRSNDVIDRRQSTPDQFNQQDIAKHQFEVKSIRQHFRNLEIQNEMLKQDSEGYIFAFNKRTMVMLSDYAAQGRVYEYLRLWNYLTENPDVGRIEMAESDMTKGIDSQTPKDFYAQESKVKVKLKKNAILKIIQEEIDFFVKQIEHEEKFGKLLDEFSSVFLEALEIDDKILQKNIRNSLALITENWGNNGFSDNQSSQSNQNTDELMEIKREIMLHLTGLNKQQLQTILNNVKAQKPVM